MRKISYGQFGLILGLGVIVAIFLINGALISSNVDSLREHQSWVEHTHVVLNTLEDLFSRVTSAEAGSRGFLINHDRRFMESFDDELKQAWVDLEKIQGLTEDNPRQQRAVEQLRNVLNEREIALRATISSFERTGKLSAEDFQNGREAMRSLRRQVNLMEQNEQSLLVVRQDNASTSYSYIKSTLFVITVLSVAFAALVYFLLRRHLLSQAIMASQQKREALLRSVEAESATLVGGDRPIAEIAEQLVEFVGRGVGAPGVNFFLVENGGLTFEAGYAVIGERRETSLRVGESIFKMGEGIVGSAALRNGISEIHEVPADYFRFQSSFGDSAPKHLVFVPIRFQKQVVGLIEVALFEALGPDQLEWLNIARETVGVGLNALISRQHQQALLEETQRQAEEMQLQQEELRTSNEELEQQARELMHSQERLQVQQEELQQINQELEQQSRALETEREAVDLRNRDLETSKAETEAKAVELERTSQYKSEFLAKMSHELRTPLNSLMILASLLQENRHGNLTSQQVDFAETIFGAGGDLLNLINDILDLSKLEARKLAARPEVFPLAPFLEQMVGIFKPLVEPKGLELNVAIAGDVPVQITSDRQRLQQIIRNLLSNAVKFTDHGSITLAASAGSRPDSVKISVRDTGIGIPDNKKQLIFEAFEQADGSVSRRYGGTGLGLSISRELAILLGGAIAVESESDRGSCFTLEIPIELHVQEDGFPLPQVLGLQPTSVLKEPHVATDALNGVGATAAGDPLLLQSVSENARRFDSEVDPKISQSVQNLIRQIPADAKTILIVEDDSTFRQSVVEASQSFGFYPLPVGDGESALELLRRHVPQAILLDIGLPGMSGLTVLETVKEMPGLRHVPIHIISAMEHQQSTLRMGAVGFLAKPVSIGAVRAALVRIESVLSRSVKRLLIVEDDAAQRKAIAELVDGQDVEIYTVGTGKEAVETLKSRTIDCVILDLSLPDCTGFELLERLGAQSDLSLPPVIIYTGKDLTKTEEDRLRRYSDSIIIKGAKSPERLIDEVSLFLHRVETALPEEKRAMLADLRHKDRAFDGRSVLVVDDDLRNVFALTSALETRGFKVVVARNGIEALEALGSKADNQVSSRENDTGARHIDLVLMDIMMPKMDGFEAMRRIRQIPSLRKLPIIALTAKTMKGEYERCIEAGASDYLPKPINLANLLSVLKVWLPAPGIMT